MIHSLIVLINPTTRRILYRIYDKQNAISDYFQYSLSDFQIDQDGVITDHNVIGNHILDEISNIHQFNLTDILIVYLGTMIHYSTVLPKKSKFILKRDVQKEINSLFRDSHQYQIKSHIVQNDKSKATVYTLLYHKKSIESIKKFEHVFKKRTKVFSIDSLFSIDKKDSCIFLVNEKFGTFVGISYQGNVLEYVELQDISESSSMILKLIGRHRYEFKENAVNTIKIISNDESVISTIIEIGDEFTFDIHENYDMLSHLILLKEGNL